MNRGTDPTTIQSLSTSGRPVTLTDNTCAVGLVLKSNEACSFTASITPTIAGRWDGAVSLSHSGAASADIWNLRSTAVTSDVKLSFSSSLVDFGPQSIRIRSAAKALKVTNDGQEPAFVTRFGLAENALHYGLNAADCEGEIQPGESCTLQTTFNPNTLGRINSRIFLELEDGTVLHAAALTGTGVQGTPSFDVSTLTFLNAPLNTSSVKQVTVTNIGSGTLNVDNVTYSGDPSFKVLSTTCGGPLAVQANCTITVEVFPTVDQIRSGTVTLVSSSSSSPLTRVQVFYQPELSNSQLEWVASSLDFGNVPVGTSAVRSVTIRSTGNAAATVSSYNLTGTGAGSFALVNSGNCLGTLQPGMQCSMDLRATPTQTGTLSAQLTTQASTASPVAPVSLQVNGIAGSIAATPAALTFTATEVGASATLTTTLSNTGSAPVLIGTVNVPASLAGVTVSGCSGQTLAPAANCTLTVRFAPTSVATISGNLTVNHNGQPSSTSVAVAAQSVVAAAPAATLEPFVCTPTPTQTSTQVTCAATLRSTGTATVTVGALSHTGTLFTAPTSNCPASLAPGGNCVVTTRATPTTAGSFSTTVSVVTGAGNKSRVASITAAAASARLNTLSHGVVRTGTSDVRTHMLSNTGAFPVTVTMPATLANASTVITVGGTPATGTLCTNGQTLDVGQSCMVTTTCAPTAATAVNATLSAVTSAGTVTGAVSCQGELPPAAGNALTFTPNPIDLGGVSVGAPTSRIVTVRNTANTPVTISAMSLSGAQASEFTLTANTCIKALAPATSCQVTVNGNATALGLREAQLNVTANTATPVPAVAVRMTGQRGILTLSPAAVTFPTTFVGSTRSATLTVSNTGTAPLTVSSVTLSGPNAARYSITGSTCANATLAVGGSCTFSAVFAPNATGNSTASVTVASTNAAIASASSSLSGTAEPAPASGGVISLGADCLSAVQYGQPSACSATVTSNGNATLTISGYTLTRTAGDYASTRPVTTLANAAAFTGFIGAASYSTANGQLSLPPGSSARLTVVVQPQIATTAGALLYNSTAGKHVNTLALRSNAPVALTANMEHNVVAPALEATVNPTSLSLIAGTSSNFVFTVTNKGTGSVKFATATTGTATAPASISTVTGTGALVSLQNTGTCTSATVLAPGASCTTVASCTPASPTGAIVSRLTFNTAVALGSGNVLVPTRSADVRCAGQPATATITPVGGTTTAVATGSRSGNWMRFTNTSTASMTITALAGSPSFVLFTETGNASHCLLNKVLQPGQSCDFAEIVTKENATGNPQTVPSANHFVNTNRGSFPFSSTYSVTGLSVTPSSAVPATMQKGDTRDVVLTVRNTSPSALSDIVVTPSANVSVLANGCTAVPVGGSCNVTVRLSPALSTAGAAFTAGVTVAGRFERILNGVPSAGVAVSNGGSWSQAVTLSSPSATLAAGSHTPIPLGSTNTAIHTLTNTGSGPLTVGQATVTGNGLKVTDSTCPASLAAGTNCTVTTTFAPVAAGAVSGTLSVPTSAGTKTATLNTFGALVDPVSGTGNFGSITVGANAYTTLKVTNGSPSQLAVSSLVLPANVTRPPVVPGDCAVGNFTLASGASCNLRLQWSPKAEGTLDAVMVFNSNYPYNGSQSVRLQGVAAIPVGTMASACGYSTYSNIVVSPLTGLVTYVEAGNRKQGLNLCDAFAGTQVISSAPFIPAPSPKPSLPNSYLWEEFGYRTASDTRTGFPSVVGVHEPSGTTVAWVAFLKPTGTNAWVEDHRFMAYQSGSWRIMNLPDIEGVFANKKVGGDLSSVRLLKGANGDLNLYVHNSTTWGRMYKFDPVSGEFVFQMELWNTSNGASRANYMLSGIMADPTNANLLWAPAPFTNQPWWKIDLAARTVTADTPKKWPLNVTAKVFDTSNIGYTVGPTTSTGATVYRVDMNTGTFTTVAQIPLQGGGLPGAYNILITTIPTLSKDERYLLIGSNKGIIRVKVR